MPCSPRTVSKWLTAAGHWLKLITLCQGLMRRRLTHRMELTHDRQLYSGALCCTSAICVTGTLWNNLDERLKVSMAGASSQLPVAITDHRAPNPLSRASLLWCSCAGLLLAVCRFAVERVARVSLQVDERAGRSPFLLPLQPQ